MQIHDHAQQGDIAGVVRQITNGIDIDCAEKYSSKTPLMCAVASADAGIDMLRFLVENGADVNAVGGELQDTVLGLAVKSDNLDKVQFLLDVGADIHYQRPHGYDTKNQVRSLSLAVKSPS
jgi:ankyrin repeat protein